VRTTRKGREAKNTISRALIFLCDIVDYSLLDQTGQETSVKKLWSILTDDEFPKAHDKIQLHVQSTGDGFYLVSWDNAPSDALELFEFAERYVSKARKLGLEVRCALHSGPVHRVKTESLFNTDISHIAGAGLNDTARIINYASKLQIAISDEFLREFGQNVPRKVRAVLTPAIQVPPFQLSSKHNRPIYIRFNSPTPSPKMVYRGILESKLLSELDSLVQTCFDHYPQLSHLREDSRISIFQKLKVEDEYFLECSLFRFSVVNSNFGLKRETPRNSTYLIRTTTEASEGLSKVLHASDAIVLPDLPDYGTDPDGYAREVSDGWSIPEQTVHNWSKKARCLIAIPMILSDLTTFQALSDLQVAQSMESMEPFTDGVLCWDSMQPMSLSNVSHDEIEDFVAFVFEQVTHRISPLWRLWVSM
jgi:hypothetical protein